MLQRRHPYLAQGRKRRFEGQSPRKDDKGPIPDQLMTELASELAKAALCTIPRHCSAESTADNDTDSWAGVRTRAGCETEERGAVATARTLHALDLSLLSHEEQAIRSQSLLRQTILMPSIDAGPWPDASPAPCVHLWCSYVCGIHDPVSASVVTASCT